MIVPNSVASVATKIAIPHQPFGRARREDSALAIAVIGQPLADDRGRGTRGNREVPPHLWRRGLVGETGFPPRERAAGERRSRGQRGDELGAAVSVRRRE